MCVCVCVQFEVPHARTNSVRGLVVLNQVLVVVERELHKMPDPGRLSGLDLLLAGFVA